VVPARQLHHGPPTTNAEMVQMLLNHGSISTDSVVGAFKAVDRGFFIDPPDHGRGEEVRFINMPFRNGVQHLSAPGIYATALESLDLEDGLSFLNVCSGTGYLSALACQILGTKVRRPPHSARFSPPPAPQLPHVKPT
jgi:protein-L-isoaspartate O-methyltransferase